MVRRAVSLKHDRPTGQTTGQTEWHTTGHPPHACLGGWPIEQDDGPPETSEDFYSFFVLRTLGHRDTSAPRHFGTSADRHCGTGAEVSGHFGTALVPKCPLTLRLRMLWHQDTLAPANVEFKTL